MAEHVALGKFGESLAVRFLKQQGYQIIDQNYRCPLGEIDIVAKCQDTLCFVEVKSRRSVRAGDPLESISRIKQRRLVKIAYWYLAKNKTSYSRLRFDAIGIKRGEDSKPVIRLVKNAFDASP